MDVEVTLASTLPLKAMWLGPDGAGWPAPEPHTFIIRAPHNLNHAEPSVVAMLASWADSIRAIGGSIVCSNELRTPYSYRSGVLCALTGGARPTLPLHGLAPPFRVRVHNDRAPQFAALCDAIGIHSAGSAAAVTKTISELSNNVFEHADAHDGYVICGSRFASNDRITIAVVDHGLSIPRHMRRRHGQDLSDAHLLQRAIEPQVSGTFAPGSKGKASYSSTNAGLGLYVVRQLADASEGHFLVLSGQALIRQNAGMEVRLDALPHGWPGTAVCVTFRPSKTQQAYDSLGKVLGQLSTTNRKHEPFSWGPCPANNAARLQFQPTFRGLLEDKAQANAQREGVVLPRLRETVPVEIDLTEGSIIAHSFAHALLFEAVRTAYPNGKRLLYIRARTDQVRSVVRAIALNAASTREAPEEPPRST